MADRNQQLRPSLKASRLVRPAVTHGVCENIGGMWLRCVLENIWAVSGPRLEPPSSAALWISSLMAEGWAAFGRTGRRKIGSTHALQTDFMSSSLSGSQMTSAIGSGGAASV